MTGEPGAAAQIGANAGGAPTRHRAVGVIGACATGLAVWAVGAVLGADYRVCVPAGCTVLDARAMLVTIVAAGLLGWATLAAAERILRRGRRVWTALAVATTAASMVPIDLVAATAVTKAALVVSHLAVAAVLIPAYLHPKRTRQSGGGA